MPIEVRSAAEGDIAAMAVLRADDRDSVAYWEPRVRRYLTREHSPRQARAARAAFVAAERDLVVGFVAGHLTRRYQCDGELQWVNVALTHRRSGIAVLLIHAMNTWFIEQRAFRVCVDVEPSNTAARALYTKCGARSLNSHWMFWDDVRATDWRFHHALSR